MAETPFEKRRREEDEQLARENKAWRTTSRPCGACRSVHAPQYVCWALSGTLFDPRRPKGKTLRGGFWCDR